MDRRDFELTKRNTPWQSYTPGSQGWGTITSVTFMYSIFNGTLWVQGRWTTGTVTADEARILFPVGVGVSHPSIGPVVLCGPMGSANVANDNNHCFIEPDVNYFTFGRNGGSDKDNGNAWNNTEVETMFGAAPLAGY